MRAPFPADDKQNDQPSGEEGIRLWFGYDDKERLYDRAEPCGFLPLFADHAAYPPGVRLFLGDFFQAKLPVRVIFKDSVNL